MQGVDFTFHFINYGQSPAAQVAYQFKLAYGFPTDRLFQTPEDMCAAAEALSNKKGGKLLLETIFPHAESAPKVSGAGYETPRNTPLAPNLMVGCIAYQGLGKTYHTRVVYDLTLGDVINNPIPYRPVEGFKLKSTYTN
jgi:hypothetical protein